MSPRRSLLLVGAVLAPTLLGGCSYLSPQTTASPYAASDGIVAQVGEVGLRNIMVISAGKGSLGQVYGSVVNNGNGPARLSLSSSVGALAPITLPPGGKVVNLKTRSQRIAKVPVQPGQTMPLTVTVNGTASQVSVPVLDGTLPEYRTLVPSATASPAAPKSPVAPVASPSATR